MEPLPPTPGTLPSGPTPGTVAHLRGVWKRFFIVTRRTPRLGAWVLTKMVEYLQRVPFYALRDVSLEVRRGQILGVIGPNGSGKSTLLKVLAGITPPTRGTVKLRGRVASLLEVGVGFHPDLTGMENIFYHAALHGLCHDEVLERLETIIEFSGLRDYLYEPVKHYSSGMYARLGCSVALHLDPEIALIDEILSVGDTEFRERVHSRMRRMIDSGVTVVLVTHEVGTAASFCQELIWLDGGRVRARGRPEEIQRAYERELVRRRLPEDHVMARALLELQQSEGENPENERVEGTAEPAAIAKRDSGGAERKAEILSARFLDAEGQPLQRVRTGETLRLEVEAHARGSLGSTAMRVIVWRSNGEVLGSHLSPAKLLGQGQTGRWRLRWDPVLWLSPAVHFTVALVDPRDPDRAVSAPYPSLGLEVVPPTMPDIHIPHLVPCRWQRTGNGEERRPHEGGL